MRKTTLATFLAGVLLVATAGPLPAATEGESPVGISNQPTDRLSPGLRYLEADGVSLRRYADRIEIDLSMTTPTPGTYVYPDTVPVTRQASPEAFTMWVFIFNAPQACLREAGTDQCGPDDFNEIARGGVYGVAGHVTSIDHSGGAFELDRDAGRRMAFHGVVHVGDPQREMPPGEPTFPLEDPFGAEVHVAIAPHGQVDPATVASELYEPAGTPTCGCWWLAFFEPPGDPGDAADEDGVIGTESDP